MKTRKRLEAGLGELARLDPRMAALWERTGTPDPRPRKPGFASLLRVIVGQQLSARAAASIWARMEAAGVTDEPAAFLDRDDDTLRALGLSRAKVGYGQSLARAIAARELDLARVHRMADEEAIAAISAQRGLGRWSAECYLLFALGRPDIMPADDLAIAVAAGRLFDGGERLKPAVLRQHAEAWRPWRSAAARLLWHAYGIDAL
ncbi:MAG: DNA-3-methyladenine glycosylase [Alphaproteobacteria bacterium]